MPEKEPRTAQQLPLSELTAVTPLDGRYRWQTTELAPFVSEYALIQARMNIEGSFLVALSDFGIIRLLSEDEKKTLSTFGTNLTLDDAQKVKEIEDTTRHDIKAMEMVFKTRVSGTSLEDLTEWIHFGLTSEDVNNLAYRSLLHEATQKVCIPTLDSLTDELVGFSEKYKSVPMLGRTHGQAAIPTTIGKELVVFANRLNGEVRELQNQKLTGKITGAIGNLSALHAAFPDKNWGQFSQDFVRSLGFEPNLITTQINPYDDVAAYFQNYQRINNILLGFDQDMWRYISDDWFEQDVRTGEKGSSTMPQKINPIYFENSEGNLGMANAILEYLSRKLAISRLQRDLSDSTSIRNIGTALGFSVVGYNSAAEGLGRIRPNEEKISQDLLHDWTILAEPVQIILRREGQSGAYDKLVELTRGKHVGKREWRSLIKTLGLPEHITKELQQLNPQNYIGLAIELTDKAINEIRESKRKM